MHCMPPWFCCGRAKWKWVGRNKPLTRSPGKYSVKVQVMCCAVVPYNPPPPPLMGDELTQTAQETFDGHLVW